MRDETAWLLRMLGDGEWGFGGLCMWWHAWLAVCGLCWGGVGGLWWVACVWGCVVCCFWLWLEVGSWDSAGYVWGGMQSAVFRQQSAQSGPS